MPIALQLGAMIGIAALVYPSAANWFAVLDHNSEISGYVSATRQLGDAGREAELAAARAYNSHMPAGMLRDPYSAPLEQYEQNSAYTAYEKVLSIGGNDVIGELDYQRIGISLPIYHGTDEASISKGAGHLYGSSLPIGGPSTHAVLTAHSGLLNASLFTPLTKAKLGDTFEVSVLGETHYYRVDSIETVLPEQTESLTIVDGEDFITLITCTPTGINSHRLLVRGVRVPAPASDGTAAVAGDGRTAGFPWWALVALAGSGAVAYLLFSPPRSGRARAVGPDGARPGDERATSERGDDEETHEEGLR